MSKKTLDDYAEFDETSDKKIISIEGFGEDDATDLSPLLQKFIIAQSENKIVETLKEELPEESPEEIQTLYSEIQNNVANWNADINEINISCAEGSTVEEWLSRKLSESAIGVNVQDYENFLSSILDSLHKENFDFLKNLGMENSFIAKPSSEMPEQIGREIQISGLAGTILNTGWQLAEKLLPADKIREIQFVADSLRRGDDSGLKSTVVAALMTAVKKNTIHILPKNTPIETITGIACFGVEQAKIMLRFADGDISSTQALTLMGRAAVVNASFVMSKLGEKIGRQVGEKIGIAIGTILPALAPVGAILGSYIGAAVGRIGGSAVGKALSKAAEKLSKVAEPFILRICNSIKTAKRIFEGSMRNLTSIFE